MNKTIIIQGRITKWTQPSIELFKVLTDARIIVSTWQGEHIDTDVEVFYLDDPGSGPIQNFNRQLVGLNEILQECEDGLVFKTRSDAVHNRDPFELFYNCPVDNKQLGVLNHKIFISSVMSVDPFFPIGERNATDRLFSPSDWLFLGQLTDVKEWFNIREQSTIVAGFVDCCEQIFCVSNFIKSHAGKNMNLANWNAVDNKQMSLDFIKANLKILHTNRTLNARVGRYMNNHDTDETYLGEER